ncbi:transglutaminase-like cysteine peptidase [Arcobacter sp. CECT 8983]|uniref:transglutaminase-like cysteine peptidase n=1 Tax=Arcobacter sp. CECT 8983 TaxID=2044508 RepID=UPI0013E90ADB|nr:transglutaminase-like cysteine peptidase [Arcobacter sp. CECT 8983]
MTNEDKIKLKDNPNKKAVYLRLIKYLKLKNKIKDFTLEKKLNYVNTFYNKILPVDDSTKYSSDDYWATPKEFLIEGKGDCEDYAIAKYFTLKEVGISKDKLFLAVVKVKGATNYHMVLTYLENKNSMPLILDNLSFRVLPFNKRPDLIPKFIFNEKEAFILKNKKIYKKVKNIDWGKEDKWNNLLKRIYEENE